MKNYFYILILFLTTLLATSKQVYLTVQMMDQIQIINIEDMQIEQSIMTEFSDASNSDSCMDIETEMNCNMTEGCEWMMGMCMESMSQDNINL